MVILGLIRPSSLLVAGRGGESLIPLTDDDSSGWPVWAKGAGGKYVVGES
jgi:hypothetical protein